MMMIDFTYQELKEDHGLSDDQIQKLDMRALKVLGNTLIMINGCLKSKQSCKNKISSILIYVSMAKEMLEKNLLESISESIPKEQLN